MLRTRVGYTGGSKKNPTYRSLGDHTESIQIDFDPEVISYEWLLKTFWRSHNPCARAFSQQYKAAVFYQDEEQRRVAERTRDELGHLPDVVETEILPAATFYRAEDYHQKYRLRGYDDLEAELKSIYPDSRDFTDSTAAARINAYVAGEGTSAGFERDLPRLGLSAKAQAELRRVVARRW